MSTHVRSSLCFCLERKDYDPPALETLFKKTTTALPNIYWLPLTEDQVSFATYFNLRA